MRASASLLILVVSLPGAWRAERLWRADRLSPSEAAALFPASSARQFKLGRFDRALAINPGLGQAWVRKGLDAEMAGDLQTAERCLVRAAEANRGVLPRWTLANFYSRRGDMANFWIWARRSVDVSYSDPAPVFQLAWQVSDDAAEIESRLIGSDETTRRYLGFLLDANHLSAAGPVAIRAARSASAADTGLILMACDRFLMESQTADAVEVWNWLGIRGLHPYGKLDPAHLPVNGNFSRVPLGRGFDWIFSQDAAVSVYTTGAEVIVSFSGAQAESLDLLWQHLVLRAGLRYQLRFTYRTEGLEQGPQWRFGNLDLGGQPPSELWREGGLELQGEEARLVLYAQRRPGSIRPQGVLYLRNVRLAPEGVR